MARILLVLLLVAYAWLGSMLHAESTALVLFLAAAIAYTYTTFTAAANRS